MCICESTKLKFIFTLAKRLLYSCVLHFLGGSLNFRIPLVFLLVALFFREFFSRFHYWLAAFCSRPFSYSS